ncbi:MAG: LPS-assembly protein LptD [Puniceicoccales bacterium]|nr:LPS-assembly protein LptD [Puniceicoccales bacterium]
MKPPVKWLLAAALASAPIAAASATPARPGAPDAAAAPENSAPRRGQTRLGDLSISASRYEGLLASKNITAIDAIVDYDGQRDGDAMRITAPSINVSFAENMRSVTATGETRFDAQNLRLLARGIFLGVPAGSPRGATTAKAGESRFGIPPLFFESKETRLRQTPPAPPPGPSAQPEAPGQAPGGKPGRVTTTEASFGNVTLYYQEPDFWSLSVSASSITLTGETPADAPARGQRDIARLLPDATLHVEDAVVRVAGVPVLYIPSFTQQGIGLPPLRPIIRAGQKNNLGAFLRTTTYYTGLGWGMEPGLLLDGYAKAGVLVGPALEYDTRLGNFSPQAPAILRELPAKGSLQGGWINDNSRRGLDDYDRAIGHPRGFLSWEHKQTLPVATEGLEISAALNYWSDTSVLRDFRPGDFNNDQRPDNFIEIMLPRDGIYFSAFARFRPNDYADVQQRLPELRVDMPSRPLARTGLNHHFNAAFTYLYERTSPEFDFQKAGHTETVRESPRLDLYYGVDHPIKFRDWFSLTPVAGVRATTYFSPVETDGSNQGDPFTRVLPQLGFDLHLLASGRQEYRNEFWEIDGLRHRMRPLAQYRWIPGADKDADRIPALDRYSFASHPPSVDLEQSRHADDLRERQILRLGLENVFETRDEAYGSRNLLWANFYQDFRDTTRPNERTRSVFYTQLGFSPARWIDMNFFNRLDTYSLRSREISAQLDIHDGDRWRLWFGAQYTTDIGETNQYYWGLEYRLNSNYSLRGFWRFDSATDRISEQYYGLRQNLGATWNIEYHVAYRRDARRDDGFSFGATLHLVRY